MQNIGNLNGPLSKSSSVLERRDFVFVLQSVHSRDITFITQRLCFFFPFSVINYYTESRNVVGHGQKM